MLDQKDIELLKGLMQETIKPITERLDKLENKLDVVAFKEDHTRKKLDDLSLDIKLAEREIRRDIAHLQDDTETIAYVLQGKGILPKAQ